MNTAPRIDTVAETRSTNADMALRAREGAGEGEWLRAERQTGGRGRLGREWLSPSGNLYCSSIVRLRPGDPPAHSLAFVAGLALHDAIAGLSKDLPLMLKWPNDLLLGGGKCAGILLEREGTGDAVILGFGVNVASAPAIEGRSTASLADHALAVTPDALLAVLAERMQARLMQWRETPLPALLGDWCAKAHAVGTPLEISGGGQRQAGAFAGLADEGALQLRLPDGSMATISAGDVSLIASEG